MSRMIFPVHQINEYIKSMMDNDLILREVWVQGEISNFKLHSSGHMYFTLKDEKGRIRCVLFRYYSNGLNFLPRDGMKVIVKGNISVYCRDGQYQLYVEYMERDGLGQLYAAFEALKEKLKAEGLFNLEFKKPLPHFPKKIGVITSSTGAAVRDIIKVIKKRNPYVDILVIPVLVQGELAKGQICAALDYASTRNDIDVIILGRGGGSIEELWAFNEEEVARAIFRCRIPVISAVGHETDFTISDFVADMRAATPSAAGEIAVPEIVNVKQMLDSFKKDLKDAFLLQIQQKKSILERLVNSFIMKHPERLLHKYIQQLDYNDNKLEGSIARIIEQKYQKLCKLVASLDALNPLAVLTRGFAIAMEIQGNQIIPSVKELEKHDQILLRMRDGNAICDVRKIIKENEVNDRE